MLYDLGMATIANVIATCIVGLAVYYFVRSGLFRYSLDVLERKWNGYSFPWYECIGGIISPLNESSDPHIDMDDVPDFLYEKALDMTKLYGALGRQPIFDIKIVGRRYSYWIYSNRDSQVHILHFSRRPRFFG